MRLRSRPVLFARMFVDAATTRPFLNGLLEQRRAAEPRPLPCDAQDREPDAPAGLPRAA